MMSQVAAKAAFRRIMHREAKTNPLFNIVQTRSLSNCGVSCTSFHDNRRSGNRNHFSRSRYFSNMEMSDIQDLKTAKGADLYDPLAEDYYPVSIDEEDKGEAAEIEEARKQAIRDGLDAKTGRLWEDRWSLTDEDWSTGKAFDDLPDWNEEICSRVSRERVRVHPDGVPTLDVLTSLPMLPSPPLHPALGDPNSYVKHRKGAIINAIYDAVEKFAEPRVENIFAMNDWNEKQDAIDDLFEQVHDAVKKTSDDGNDYISVVLGSQPNFPKMVEQALEDYLGSVRSDEKAIFDKSQDGKDSKDEKDIVDSDSNPDESAVPIFMDLMKAEGSSLDSEGVPKLIYPLKKHRNDGAGRMLEEWELFANDKTRRIMIRQCTREIGRALNDSSSSRVFVTGIKGAGKTAVLASIVASARQSGHIVLYLPDGDRLRKNGFYIEPNNHRMTEEGKLFDLPVLSQEVCGQLMESHAKDFEGMSVSKESMEKIVSVDQMKKLLKLIESPNEDGSLVLKDLLKVGSENVGFAAACYSAAVDTLMSQTATPFTIVVDQFNCFYDQGHYFHGDYDREGKKAIPMDKISLFKPLVDAMGLVKNDEGDLISKDPVLMKVGGIIAGITGSHAVPRQCTKDLISAITNTGATIVDVPQYSALEVEHILANFEIIGIGRLRFDRGETVMNNQEVAYLRMVSGAVGQPLLDACVN